MIFRKRAYGISVKSISLTRSAIPVVIKYLAVILTTEIKAFKQPTRLRKLLP